MDNRKVRKILLLASVLLPTSLLCGCQPETDPNTIFVSSAPVYVLVREIVRDIKPMEIITPPGIEAHDYEISARKVAKIYDGLGLFVNGLGLESWASKLPETAKNKTFNLSEGIETIEVDGNVDPHIWLNPKNAIKELEKIKDAMVTIDSENSSAYLSNFLNSKAHFEALDKECEQVMKSLNNKYLCVSHAAFGYMCNRYGLTQIAVNGLDPSREPTTKALQEIIDCVQTYKITTIFAEEIGSQAIAEKVADETGCKLETLSTMEEVEGSDGYCSIYLKNLLKIKEAGE